MTEFVGRVDELDVLRAALAAADDGRPQTVLVDGAAGVGKSALVAAFIRTLSDARPLLASGDEAEASMSFGVLHQLVGGRVANWPDPFVAGAELVRFLDHRQASAPAVLVVDDAHLADVPSLTALTFALRRLRDDRVLAILTTRDRDVDRVPPGLMRLTGSNGHRIALAGLTDAEVVDLGAARGVGPLSERAAGRLREHTSGNPLHLCALIDELTKEDLNSVASQLPAPRSFALLVLSSLAATSLPARKLARAAAVVGDGAALALVADVAGVANPAAALEELQQARILTLRTGPGGWELRFDHPLVRAAVYDDVGPATRARLHLRAAELSDGAVALNHLVEAALGPDAGLADRLAERGNESKDRGDLLGAAESLLTAFRLTPRGDLADRRLLDAVELLLLAGDVAAAKAYAGRVAQVPAGAQRLHVQARLAWLSGQAEEAADLAIKAWELGSELDPQARAGVAAILAQLAILRGEGDSAASWAQRALSTGRLPPELADATSAAAAIGLSLAGRARDGLELVGTLPSDPLAVGAGQRHQLRARGILRMVTDDAEGARGDLAALCSAQRDLSPYKLMALGALAEVEYRLGDWDGSLAVAEHAISLARDAEQLFVQGYLHSVAVMVAAGRGLWEQAQRHLDVAQEMAALLGDPATVAYAGNAAVHLAACRADPHQVVARASGLLVFGSGPAYEPGTLGWPVQYVAALVDLGRLDEGETQLRVLETVAQERESRSRLAELARVRGQLSAARRESGPAREAFEEALSLGEEVVDALERATAHACYGRFLRRRGERRAARHQLRVARELYARLGAQPFLQRCDDELAACGVAADHSLPSANSTLTPQEQIVTRLVCGGKTNQQVADELVLSVKTVGYHLANAYTKLGVHSRTQLAAALRPTITRPVPNE